jgi:hypothetical protein
VKSQLHFLEQSKILLDWPISILGGKSISSFLLHFFLVFGADKGVSLFDEPDCILVEEIEVI